MSDATMEKVTMKAMKCADCSTLHLEGIACCPKCGSDNIFEVEASGNGEIYSYTIMNFVPVGPHKGRAPYIIAVIKTDEGMMLSAIVETDDPDTVAIGDKVSFKEHVEDTGWFFKKG